MSEERPSRISIAVCSELKAMHSLSGFEVPHVHVWEISLRFDAEFPIPGDRVFDLPVLQSGLNQVLSNLENTFLNETLGMSPTSENLCWWIWREWQKRNPSHPLVSVEATLRDPSGRVMGKATLRA